MSEQPVPYMIDNHQFKKPNMVKNEFAVQRLIELCYQFESMTEEEKQLCIEQVQEECNGELVEFYNALHEYVRG